MSASDARHAVRDVLDLIRGDAHVRPSAAELLRRLDRLAVAMHGEPPSAPKTERDPPRGDERELRERVAARFPMLGLYREPGLDPGGEREVGDAVDDLVDIALDLADAEWLWEHAGAQDALWQLSFTYRTHWGEHLRGLQWVLHALASTDR